MFKNTTILITGGTGSLGKGLIRRLLNEEAKIVVYSRDEAKQAELVRKYPSIIRVIGDVRDFDQLDTTMKIHKPDYVFHTGALKRVDDIEFYPMEGIKTID
jgi:UDP-N-acetylglucosamine 4,6-dehydratase